MKLKFAKINEINKFNFLKKSIFSAISFFFILFTISFQNCSGSKFGGFDTIEASGSSEISQTVADNPDSLADKLPESLGGSPTKADPKDRPPMARVFFIRLTSSPRMTDLGVLYDFNGQIFNIKTNSPVALAADTHFVLILLNNGTTTMTFPITIIDASIGKFTFQTNGPVLSLPDGDFVGAYN